MAQMLLMEYTMVQLPTDKTLKWLGLCPGWTGGYFSNRLSLRNNRLKFETSGELPIILEESIEYTSNE